MGSSAASNAATHSIPPPARRNSGASGPTAKGNAVATSRKNSTGSHSAPLPHARRRSRQKRARRAVKRRLPPHRIKSRVLPRRREPISGRCYLEPAGDGPLPSQGHGAGLGLGVSGSRQPPHIQLRQHGHAPPEMPRQHHPPATHPPLGHPPHP